MYLSRLVLNLRSRAARRDLADCQAMHRTIMSAFPTVETGGAARERFGVLYRADTNPRTGGVTLLVQSRVVPEWSRLEPGYLEDMGETMDNPTCKCIDEKYACLRADMVLAFRIRANPTRKVDTRSGADGERRNGRRVEVRGETPQIEWLQRKGELCGFRLLKVRASPNVPDARAIPEGLISGWRAHKDSDEAAAAAARLTFSSVLFDGVLRVVDAERFRGALEGGIGSGKAYGFGLLSIARARG
ncbi:MAG: type I-E CRISPR-associated protein Cas6/Cse3/CasE [Chloroflexi bacterium]|nr:type I-E CRISPR-associated protein Cas6/Cse3/CasE [Chloroflexota bacterium]